MTTRQPPDLAIFNHSSNIRGKTHELTMEIREDKGNVGAATVREGRLCHVLWRGEEKRVLMKTLPHSSMIRDRAPRSDRMESCVLLDMCDTSFIWKER